MTYRNNVFVLSVLLTIMSSGFAFSQAKTAPNTGGKKGNVMGPVMLWPEGAPGEEEATGMGEEKDMTKPDDRVVAGKEVIRLGNVSDPTLTIYYPKKKKATGTAMIVCPGGGYHILAMDLEGTEVCDWLNSIGVTAILLKYRVPVREGLPRYMAPLQDAQRALGLVRYHASQWGIDPARIGIMGFSAGGHLSATVSNHYEKRVYEPLDEADQVSCRPDFTMLVYPAYLTKEPQGYQLPPELPVSAQTPPTLLIQTEDDPVHVESSLFYYLALKQSGVPAEMHLFAEGGHGYGLRKTDDQVTQWPLLAEAWLRSLGVLKSRK